MQKIKLSKKDIDDIAKDLCWEDGGGPKCEMDCQSCKTGSWKHYKWVVPVVIRSYEKIIGR